MNFTYAYPRPALAVDCAVLTVSEQQLQILLIQRAADPFAKCWALPGGFVEMHETTDQAARRELHEETGLVDVFLEQLYTFSAVDRDPRERVVSVAHFALLDMTHQTLQAASDATQANWFSVSDLPDLAFDHAEIVEVALARLRGKLRYQPIGFELLPDKFSLTQLQELHEIILQEPLDKRNFRKKILAMDILDELDETQSEVAHRAAQLYRFNEKKYKKLAQSGFNYWI